MRLRAVLDEGKPRKLSGWPSWVIFIASIALTVYVVISQLFIFPTSWVYRGTFISVMLAITFIVFSPSKKESLKPSVIDYFLSLLSLGLGLYVQLNAERITHRVAFLDNVETIDLIAGIVTIILALEGARRTVGWILSLIALLMLGFMFGSGYIPGLFHVAGGVSLGQATDSLFLTTGGVFGMPGGVLANYIFPFGIFGAFLTVSGVGSALFDLAQVITGRFRGGIAKTAVIGSSLFGMINGSAVANVATIGTITIPMMKKAGYSRHFAAAVEATSSTGGVILPPIMGAVAFVMAEVVGVPYARVMLAGFIPGFLYFMAVFLAIDAESIKLNLKGMDKKDLPQLIPTLKKLSIFIIPIAWLVYRLLIQITPARAGFEATALIIIASMFSKNRPSFMNLLKGMERGVMGILAIGPAIVVAGMLQGVLQITGSGNKFTSLIVSAGGNHLIPAVILTAVVTIILGMGMEITPTYILAVSLAGPALITLGVDRLGANFFVMYGATMSVLTPPVALTCYTAAAIADVSFWKVSGVAMRLAIVAYVLPFSIIFRPPILLSGTPQEVIVTAVEVALAVIFLVSGLNRRVFISSKIIETVVLILAASLLFFTSNFIFNIVGISLGLVIFIEQYLRRKRIDMQIEEKATPA